MRPIRRNDLRQLHPCSERERDGRHDVTHAMLVLVQKALHILRVLDATGAGDDPDPRRQRLERIEAYLIERYKREAVK